ncbi:MAG: hypothetical protein C9356_12250 [Oleiphilus sp.]|nr:MAG: hypothetical protein C9356_12250 [Oleiphilus sp.]
MEDIISRYTLDLRQDLRQKAEKLLDSFMAEHRELAKSAALENQEPSFIQFFVVFNKGSLELRWGMRTGRKVDENSITQFFRKGVGNKYSLTTLKRHAQSWDYPLIEKYERKLRLLREVNSYIKDLSNTSRKIKNRLQNYQETHSA